jgi:hypothetical protein
VTSPADALAAVLTLVREAAREGAAQALAAHASPPSSTPTARVTLDDLARLETCSRATIRRLVAEGAPVTYVGQSPRFDVEAFRTWLDARGRQGTKAKASIAGVRLLSRGSR